MKAWEILGRLSVKDLEKIERHASFLSLAARLEPNNANFVELMTESLFRDHRLSKRDLVAKLTLQIYTGIKRKGHLHLDGSANLIVPVLAKKPYGMCPWQDLESELSSNIRPSTFAQKIRDLTLIHALVFVIRKTGTEKLLVMPEEALPMVRKGFALAPRLPEEPSNDFGRQLSPYELRNSLDQIRIFSLQTPSPNEVFELSLVKDSGKKGSLLIPTTATFGELHDVLLEFAGWDDEHLHEFQVKVSDPEPDTIVVDGLTPDGDPLETMRPGDYREDQVQLGQLLSVNNNTLSYLYDFGDRRQVVVKVLRVLPRGEDVTYPKVLPFKRETRKNHPPEAKIKGRGTRSKRQS